MIVWTLVIAEACEDARRDSEVAVRALWMNTIYKVGQTSDELAGLLFKHPIPYRIPVEGLRTILGGIVDEEINENKEKISFHIPQIWMDLSSQYAEGKELWTWGYIPTDRTFRDELTFLRTIANQACGESQIIEYQHI